MLSEFPRPLRVCDDSLEWEALPCQAVFHEDYYTYPVLSRSQRAFVTFMGQNITNGSES